MGTYVFRWPYPADHVYVTGTFDDWGKTERLNKVNGGFEKEVHLPSANDKVFYKFVVDDDWIVDDRAPKEDDGHCNVNNVLLPDQIQPITDATTSRPTRAHRVLSTSSAPPGSNAEALTEAPTVSAGSDGAPLLTKDQSQANLARWIPHVIPRGDRPVTRRLSKSTSSSAPTTAKAEPLTDAPTVSAGGIGAPLISKEQSHGNLARAIPSVVPAADKPVTRSLPQSDGASSEAPTVSAGGIGAPLISKDQSHANLAREIPHVTPAADRSVTRSLPQSEAPKISETEETGQAVPGAFPDDGADEGIVTAPALPATGHQDMQSSVTTSKEDYDNATGGEGTAGGVVSALPIPAEGQKDIQSSATTSKEDYDKVGGVDTDNQQVSVNPLPATGHNDIQSSVTTSKEDYEKAGALGTVGLIAGAGTGAALAGAFSAPKLTDKNVIPESSLGMNVPKFDTKDTGPFISSAGPGTTTADLASQVPLEPKREAQVLDSVEAPSVSKDASSEPFISSVGAGATTAGLASQVPLEAPEALKESNATPFISSSGPGTTTADLASQVPLEQKRQGQVFNASDVGAAVPGTQSELSRETGASSEVVAEKAALDKELLAKVPETEATGAPASAAKAQTSYYGLATAVPVPVEDSMAKAHASPEAATESSAVAEKSAMERELQERVPVVESAGEPAPTMSAATATTAPEATQETAASTVGTLTDGKTANEAVPDTDTSTASRGLSAGEIAGGAVAGGAAAVGAAALASRHKDRDVEPPRVATSTKPDITTEPAPHSSVAGASPVAAAQVSDGTAAESPGVEHAPRVQPPVEKSDADATDYAPPRAANMKPGVSASAAAALSDGTEDPTLSEDGPTSKSPTAGLGAISHHPGHSPAAAAALSDGTEDPTVADEPAAPKIKAPAETSEATATEYAPPQVSGVAPGVSASAAAALSDGTEDPTLSEDKGKAIDPVDQAIAKPENTVYDKVTKVDKDAPKTTETATGSGSGLGTAAAASSTEKPEGVSRSKSMLQRLSGSAPSTPKKGSNAGASTSAARTAVASSPASSSAPATPKSTTASEGGEKKKKKRNRLSQIMHKIFD